MFRSIALVLLVLLAACGRVSPPSGQVSRPVDVRQCLAGLDRSGVRYQRLPDRNFAGGCVTWGTVQLLDIGVPVARLGALTCPLAAALTDWTRIVRGLAVARLGSPLVRIESFGTFACRPINNQNGNRLSEHAFANAVDIGAFVLADGRRITVLNGWNGPDERVRGFLREAHRAGCRRFAIGLGPEANALHANHFHFDMGRGPYCR